MQEQGESTNSHKKQIESPELKKCQNFRAKNENKSEAQIPRALTETN